MTVRDMAAPVRSTPRREQLAEFLRSRRARITPEDVGIPAGPRRRTPGLRREEVAQLSTVGVTWYTWLEQGRPINVSPSVLDAISRTLRLDLAERTHLYRLADVPVPPTSPGREMISADIREVIDAMDGLAVCLVNSRYDILAWNRDYELLFPRLMRSERLRRNALYACFTMPDCCNPFVNRDEELPRMVAALRGEFGKHVGEPEWEDFIADLIRVSPTFARTWDAHDVACHSTYTKVFRHPVVGLVTMRSTSFRPAEMIGARMIVYRPIDAENAAVMERLRHLPAEELALGCRVCGGDPAVPAETTALRSA
jgi:hypothetical protein